MTTYYAEITILKDSEERTINTPHRNDKTAAALDIIESGQIWLLQEWAITRIEEKTSVGRTEARTQD